MPPGPTGPGSPPSPPGLVSLVYGLIRAGEIAWSDTGVVICLVLAAVFLGAFVAVEHRAEHPAVRSVAVPHPHLRRRAGRRLRHERFALRDAPVPRPLPPGRPRLLGARHRPTAARS